MLIISFLFQAHKLFFPPCFVLYLGQDRIRFRPMDDSFQFV